MTTSRENEAFRVLLALSEHCLSEEALCARVRVGESENLVQKRVNVC